MVHTNIIKSVHVTVHGVVQGVGFRPFVYRLACQHNLKGWVQNTSNSVDIEVEGDDTAITLFLRELRNKAPPMSHIETLESYVITPAGYTTFEIRGSQKQAGRYQLVSPDIATCVECRQEIFDPTDRRFHYPFTNCTNCGPRFTIIEDIPYDRSNTTMKVFQMCPQCRREYENPLDRRFHAQPNACPVCGPHLELVHGDGDKIQNIDVIAKAGELLKAGEILAIRGLGGFQLACDATNLRAVNLLRSKKHRPAKPFAVMLTDIQEIGKHCHLSQRETALLQSAEAPIVLLKWKTRLSNICSAVAPQNKYLGVMLPYTPLHHLLLQETRLPLVMTSGNLSEEPIAKDNNEALSRLHGIADYFVLHNREIRARYDDSVFMVEDNKPQAVRRARGYAPYPVLLPYNSKLILACGAEEKNTFCLTRDKHAFLSQHIGDLENEETLEHFEDTIILYKKLFRIEPEIVACDMHPEYLSTKYARQISTAGNLTLIPVQHHHAHIVSCMVENKVESPVIGVALDGTGYGTDGSIWGGEFLVADYSGFRRLGHLEYVPMPGGEAAIKKPYRMALSYLYTLIGEGVPLESLPLNKYSSPEFNIVKQQLRQKINSPLTSSMGRLFDAVSALLGVCGEISYSAQAAIELEMLAAPDAQYSEHYPITITEQNGVRILKLEKLISAIIQDIRHNVPTPQISFRFHVTIAEMILGICRLISKDTGLNDIVLSGGVFQNRLLQKLTLAVLRKAGYNVITHHLVPCNDGGIALGQVVVANFTHV